MARVMNDVLYNAFNIAVLLCEVHSIQARGALMVLVFHVFTGAFLLPSDHTAHGGESASKLDQKS